MAKFQHLLTRTAVLGTAAVVLAGCSSSGGGGTTTTTLSLPSALANKSAAAIAAISKAAALSKGTVVATFSSTQGGQLGTQVTSSTRTGGTQQFNLGTTKGQLVLVKGIVYFNDDAALLKDQFGVSNSKWANQWIAIPPTNGNYSRFAAGVILSQSVASLFPGSSLSVVGVQQYMGQRAVVLRGKPAAAEGISGTVTTYISTAAPFLPLGASVSGTQSGTTITGTASTAQWGQPVTLTAPSTFTLISATDLPTA